MKLRQTTIKSLEPSRHRSRLEGNRLDAIALDERPGYRSHAPEGAERLAQLLGATPRSNRFGEHLGLRRWFSEPINREMNLRAPETELNAVALHLLEPEAPSEASDPQQWLFLDTETTGLMGGTGTIPFLIGVAWWDAGGLEVEQFFMREQSEEQSVLVALAERMEERRVLVTFNGKSFDWPLIETRYRMTRKLSVPTPNVHFDFLPPARALWRLKLGSVRLAELERQVLGWNRGADMISALIPQIYFDYLRGGAPDALVPIFHHNQMDLRGLAGLATRVLSLLENAEMHNEDAIELFGISRICERRGHGARARKLYERSLAGELPADTDRAARHFLARLAKREGDLETARHLWEGILGTSRQGFQAYEQLAIYYERHAKEPQRAASLTRDALTELRGCNRMGLIAPAVYRQRLARLEKRLARIEKHCSAGERQLFLGKHKTEKRLPLEQV